MLSERQGKVKDATYYWGKRYSLGVEGEYWREIARQHLMQLGTYPDSHKEFLELEAARMSKDIVSARAQQRSQDTVKAKSHYDLGASLFVKGDYLEAVKEFEQAKKFEIDDKVLESKIQEYYLKSKRSYMRQQAVTYIQNALANVQKDDFLSAGEDLKNALSAVFRISQQTKQIR